MVTVIGGKTVALRPEQDRDRKATHNLVERGVRGSRGILACLGEMGGSLLGDTLEAGLAQTGYADDALTITRCDCKSKNGPNAEDIFGLESARMQGLPLFGQLRDEGRQTYMTYRPQTRP